MNLKLFLAIVPLMALAACAKVGPMVGTWAVNGQADTEANSLEFRGDGAFEADVAGSSKPLFTGSYEVKGKNVEVTMAQTGIIEIPREAKQVVTGQLSDDGKKLTFMGGTFTKQ
jgi:hypothetical protein